MGMLSNIQKLDCLHSVKVKSLRRIPVDSFVVIEGGMLVARLKSGRLWTNWKSFADFCLCPGTYGGKMDRFCRALIELGYITRDEFKKHMAMCEQKHREMNLKYDQEAVDRLAKQYRFKSPKLAVAHASND